MGRRLMSDKEKAYIFCLLFPLLWPLALAMLMVDAVTGIGNLFRKLWNKINGR